MNRQRFAVMALAVTLAILPQVRAETASYGFRMSAASWKESKLFGESQDASGAMFGPTLLFRLGEEDEWGIGLDGLYGSLDDMDRGDADVTLTYDLSPIFSVFADFKYLWYDFDPSEDSDIEGSIETMGYGLGLGVSVNAPLGNSGFFAFASTRLIPMSLTTDVPDADSTALLWAYEGGLAFGIPTEGVARDSSIYLSAGFRHQQMKGGDFDERVQAPFAEIGFKQEF